MSGCSAARWGRSSVLQQAAQELEVEAVAVLCPAPDVVRGALRRRELDRRLDRQLCNHERCVNLRQFSFRVRVDFRFPDRSSFLIGQSDRMALFVKRSPNR